MSAKWTLDGPAIRHFKVALQSLAKIGGDLLLETVPEKLILRTINNAKSAFLSITFRSVFFENYNVFDAPVVQTAMLMKNVLATFRTQRMSRMQFEIAPGGARVHVTISCDNGLTKRYTIECLESEVLQATVDKEAFATTVIAEAAELNKLLNTFQSNLDEMTIIANPEVTGATAAHHAHKLCQLQSFFDPAKGAPASTLHTSVSVDTRAVFLAYSHHSDEAADVTFNVRDFRAVVGLCEHLKAQISIRFDQPGTPLVAEPHFRGAQDVDLSAELVLATLTESQLTPDHQQRQQQLDASAPPPQPTGRTPGLQTPAPPAQSPFRSQQRSGQPQWHHTTSQYAGGGHGASHPPPPPAAPPHEPMPWDIPDSSAAPSRPSSSNQPPSHPLPHYQAAAVAAAAAAAQGRARYQPYAAPGGGGGGGGGSAYGGGAYGGGDGDLDLSHDLDGPGFEAGDMDEDEREYPATPNAMSGMGGGVGGGGGGGLHVSRMPGGGARHDGGEGDSAIDPEELPAQRRTSHQPAARGDAQRAGAPHDQAGPRSNQQQQQQQQQQQRMDMQAACGLASDEDDGGGDDDDEELGASPPQPEGFRGHGPGPLSGRPG